MKMNHKTMILGGERLLDETFEKERLIQNLTDAGLCTAVLFGLSDSET